MPFCAGGGERVRYASRDMQGALTKKGRGWFRRTLLQIQIGAVLGLLGWTLLGASLLGWWYTPPAGEAMSCAPTVRQALQDFARYQAIAAGVGAVVVIVVGTLVRRNRVAPAPDVPAPPAAAS